MSKASDHRVWCHAFSIAVSSLSESWTDCQDLNPSSTHWKSPPAAYWVNDHHSSSSPTAMLPWSRVAEEMRTVEPDGNSITSPSWRRIRCLPCLESKCFLQMMGQIPLLLLSESVCSTLNDCDPKLKDAGGKMLLAQFYWRYSSCS